MTAPMLAGFSSLFGFGLIVAFLGSIKLRLTSRIGADNAEFGRIIAAFQWIMVVMAILSGVAIDHVGHQMVIGVGAALAATAVLGIGRARSSRMVMAWVIILGLGGQLLYAGGNTLLPGLFADPAAGSNLGNAIFGLGALFMSVIAAVLLTRLPFERALIVFALLLLTPMVFVLRGDFPLTSHTFDPAVALTLLTNRVTWIVALLLFLYIGLEVSMGAWISSYAVELGATETQAIHTLSYFLVAMMISRLLFGLQDKVTGIELTPTGGAVLVCAGFIAIVTLSALMHTRNLRTARGWVFLIGFTFGPIFPTTIGMTLEHFAPSTWGTLFGVIATGGSMGAAVLPAWIGGAATTGTVQSSFGVLRSAAIGITAIALVLSLLSVA